MLGFHPQIYLGSMAVRSPHSTAFDDVVLFFAVAVLVVIVVVAHRM